MKNINLFLTLAFVTLLLHSCGEYSLSNKKDKKAIFLEERTGISALNYVQVSESVVMLHNEKPQGSNITCIALDDGLVFFDCSMFTEIGTEFRHVMEKKYKRKTLAIVQSHVHLDHFFGLDAFNDVPYVSTVHAKRMYAVQFGVDFERYKEGYMRIFPGFDKALVSAKLRMPSVWFEEELHLGSGDNKLILRTAGGHSECSIYGYFKKEKVILVGDNVQVNYYPYFGDPSGDLNDWIDILKTWETMDIKHVCAGHGPVTDLTYITKTRLFFETLVAKLHELKARNANEKEVLIEINALERYWPDQKKPVWYDPAIKAVYKRI